MSKFSHIVKISVFALGMAIFGLAPAAQTMSGQGHSRHGSSHSFNNHGSSHSFSRHSNRHSFNRHSNRHFRHQGGHSFRRHGGHHGGDVAFGILAGGLLFYALTANQRNYNYNRTVYVQQQPVYVRQQPVYAQPVQQPAQPQNNSCLQIREYQTTITVGGQSVPAYGQSCLQADGTWELGPAIPEPSYYD